MSLRRMFSTMAVAAALAGAGLGMASVAQAAESPTPSAAHAAVAETNSAAGYVYHDWYWTRANCNAAGTVLVNAGVTSSFYCQNNGVVVDLYIWQ